MTATEEFAALFRPLRENLDNQEAAAAKLGVSSRTLRSWETGEYAPDSWRAPDIASYVSLPVDEVFDVLMRAAAERAQRRKAKLAASAPRRRARAGARAAEKKR